MEEDARAATILVVEDERIVALELQDRLRRMGHTVAEIASSGEEAIEESRRMRPDLILMDIKLQGPMDGIDAAAAIRREQDVAIVYLTAFADDETLQRAKVTQPYGYLIKPFHDRELHVVIEVSLYRQKAERALRESELRAQRAAALRDDVLAIVSHDLRNPLSTISMGADQLLRMPGDAERVLRNANRIKRNVAQMERLIDDLLEAGRVDSGHLTLDLQRVDVRVLAAEAVSTFEPLGTERSIRIVSEALPADEVLCDRVRVLQVFSNLIGNAVKFSPEGASIRITGERAGGFLEFAVADEGRGIPSEQLERIFERYWQAPEGKHLGSGLGLYIARGVVEAHGGRIWAESTPGAGSTFHFTIPLAPQSVEQPAWTSP